MWWRQYHWLQSKKDWRAHGIRNTSYGLSCLFFDSALLSLFLIPGFLIFSPSLSIKLISRRWIQVLCVLLAFEMFLSLCLVIVSLTATWPLLGFRSVAESPLLFPSLCLAPSSARSPSSAADTRKSCSVFAYVIPTYLYVMLCNVIVPVA